MKNSKKYIPSFLSGSLVVLLSTASLFAQTAPAGSPEKYSNIPQVVGQQDSEAQAMSYVTGQAYAAFLNAVARYEDPYKLYNNGSSISAQITSSTTSEGTVYTYVGPGADLNYFNIKQVGWFAMARYCNWAQNGHPHADEGVGTTENGAYTLKGLTSGAHPSLNAGSRYYVGAGEIIPL